MVIFQLKMRIERNTSMSIQKSSVMEQTMPSLVTGTGVPNTNVKRNHGKGNLLSDFFPECILAFLSYKAGYPIVFKT